MTKSRNKTSKKSGSLTQTVIEELSHRLETHLYRPGERIPSEQALCQEFKVSRTVIREAIASLRLTGRLISQQGVGVFVADHANTDHLIELPLTQQHTDIRAALHILELRIGLEVEAAGLAAQRRTSRDLVDIVHAFDVSNKTHTDIRSAVEADFAFHLSIARATNNPYFAHLLTSAVQDVMVELALKRHGKTEPQWRQYEKRISTEHDAIMVAIVRSEPGAAREAMYQHLSESLKRYRRGLDGH